MPAPVDLGAATLETFAPYQGQTFELSEGQTLTLKSAERSRYAPAGADRPFTLLFEGDLALELPQQIFELRHPELGTLEIFLVPMNPRGGLSRYEAVFN